VWVALWQLAFVLVGQELLLPSPVHTLRRFLNWASPPTSIVPPLCRCLRIVQGFGRVSVSVLWRYMTARFALLYDFFHPAIGVIKATPVASFIILALVWIKRDNVPMFIAFLMVLPIVWANVSEGIHQTDKGLLEMARLFGFTKRRLVTKVYVPGVLPYFFAGCTTALGLAWKAGIAAEILSLPKHAVGTQLYYSKLYLETTDLFAWTVAVILMSMALEKLLVVLLNRIKSA
jgi:NitT/TauT family transport system permease protein